MKPFDTSGLVNRKHALRTVRELDAFPKVADSYKESTASGGGSALFPLLPRLSPVSSAFHLNRARLLFSV